MSQEPAAVAVSMTSAPAQPQPHVLLVAAPFQSHVNPLLRLGRRLAAKGLLITFTTALRSGIRLGPGDGDGNGGDAEADDAQRGRLRVEVLRGGGIWAPDDPRFRVAGDMARHVEAAGPAALEELVRGQAEAGRPVTCVVANAFVPWALRVAGELGLPRGMLWIQSCALLSVYYHHVHALAAFPEEDAPGSATLPGLPELEAGELGPLLIYASGQDLWRQMLVTDLGRVRPGLVASDARQVSWVFVNSFDEFEHSAIEGLREHLPVIPVGPLLDADDTHGESSSAADDDGCTAWLDARPPRSVVFVAFGSLVNNDSDEVAEIAAGLASTGRPFLWVVRDDNRALLSADALAAACCDRDRGKVVPWCAQGRVLAHPAVGCFVTHCGWNSTAEALAAGVPVVVSPRWSDQRINARFLVYVHRVGARAPTPLTRDALRERIEEVMSGPEAEAMARRAASWKEKARAAVCDGGSSDRGIQVFVDQIRHAGARH